MMLSNIHDKIFGYLNGDSVPIELLFSSPEGRFSGIDVKKSKKGKASEYAVPFFLKVFDLKETSLSNSISNCVTNLDNLAIQIDSLIDSKEFQSTSDLSIEKFDDLENKIIDCFNPLSGQPILAQLIAVTLDYVNTSFYLNTSKRHLVYILERDALCVTCTTMYLIPLMQYLSTLSKTPVEINRIFIPMANYIQLLDDFIDVFNDINSNIATPVTERFFKISHNLSALPTIESSFGVLTYDVKQKLDDYLKVIEQEIHKICGKKKANDILRDWRRFHYVFPNIPVPPRDNNWEQLNYLRDIYNITPPMLCYY